MSNEDSNIPSNTFSNKKDVPEDLRALAKNVHTAAQARQGDCFQLLELLRSLEDLHNLIRETLFQDALPTNRQRLYWLLRDIEVNGGWPYIKRMKLIEFLQTLQADTAIEESDSLKAAGEEHD